MSKEKKLYRVLGRVRISRYMIDTPEYQDLDILVEAENEAMAQILVHQTYDEKTSEYDVYYSVDIDSVDDGVLRGEVKPEYLEQYSYLLK